ncbi:hypothetical protein TrRE_jg8013, partial [Triparma retinervis]
MTDAKAIPELPSWQSETESGKGDERTGLEVVGVEFPLLAILLPKFDQVISEKYAGVSNVIVKKVVVLVTGVGTPRNWTHSVSGNSTMAAGKLMSMFVEENKE